MSSPSTDDYLAIINLVGDAALRGMDAYNKAKELGAKAGVSKEDLDAADVRYLADYIAAPAPPPGEPLVPKP